MEVDEHRRACLRDAARRSRAGLAPARPLVPRGVGPSPTGMSGGGQGFDSPAVHACIGFVCRGGIATAEKVNTSRHRCSPRADVGWLSSASASAQAERAGAGLYLQLQPYLPFQPAVGLDVAMNMTPPSPRPWLRCYCDFRTAIMRSRKRPQHLPRDTGSHRS